MPVKTYAEKPGRKAFLRIKNIVVCKKYLHFGMTAPKIIEEEKILLEIQ